MWSWHCKSLDFPDFTAVWLMPWYTHRRRLGNGHPADRGGLPILNPSPPETGDVLAWSLTPHRGQEDCRPCRVNVAAPHRHPLKGSSFYASSGGIRRTAPAGRSITSLTATR